MNIVWVGVKMKLSKEVYGSLTDTITKRGTVDNGVDVEIVHMVTEDMYYFVLYCNGCIYNSSYEYKYFNTERECIDTCEKAARWFKGIM